ncbi:MAG: hypothetical protein AAFZ58_01880 [Pseudomonadota bacterium]
MEIKDLATAVELGSEMAEVRGGARAYVGNLDLSRIKSWNRSSITNGDVYADTNVTANRASGSSFNGIGSVVTYTPSNTVTQTSGNAFDITSQLQGLNFSF